MAISLPDARQLSDEVLQSLRLRALRGCELGYSEIEVAELLGLSRETVSRWWTAYVDHGRSSPRRPHRPPGRLRSDPQRRASGTAADDPQRKKPRGGGDRLPVVDPQGRRRVDPQGVLDRHAVRTVGAYLERWGYTAKVPRRHAKDQDPKEVRHWLEVTYPAIEVRSPVRMRRSTGATRPARRPTTTATGLRPRGAAGEDRGARSPHPHEPDLDD